MSTEEQNLTTIQNELLAPTGELPVFAASLVHEIKNPLAAIHLHLQLLEAYAGEIKEIDLRKKIQEKVRFIQRQVLGLNQTLQDFLRLIRPEPQEKEVILDLNELVREMIEFIEPQALREGIDLQFQPGLLENIQQMDSTFIKQILFNLVLNSIQAFEGGEVPPGQRNIVVATGKKDAQPYIRVTDNGPGIAVEKQPHIFEPFFSGKKNGSGLGLPLVQKMAHGMGGRVEFESASERGAQFTVLLAGGQEVLEAR